KSGGSRVRRRNAATGGRPSHVGGRVAVSAPRRKSTKSGGSRVRRRNAATEGRPSNVGGRFAVSALKREVGQITWEPGRRFGAETGRPNHLDRLKCLRLVFSPWRHVRTLAQRSEGLALIIFAWLASNFIELSGACSPSSRSVGLAARQQPPAGV